MSRKKVMDMEMSSSQIPINPNQMKMIPKQKKIKPNNKAMGMEMSNSQIPGSHIMRNPIPKSRNPESNPHDIRPLSRNQL